MGTAMEVERPARNPWVVLTSTSFAVFAVFLDTTILFVAFPSIGRSFPSVAPSTMSWVLNGYTIVFAALMIPAGRLADRIGRRQVFLTAVVVFTVASMLCGIAPTAGLLIAFRVLQAIGAAALVPSSLAMVLQTFPKDKVPVAVAIWGTFGALAGAAGPTLGALVVEDLGWRWAFYINLPVGIVSLVLGYKVLPFGKEANPGRLPDPLSIGLLISGLGLAAYGIVHTDATGWTSGTFAVTELAAAALIAVFILRSRQVTNPLLNLDLFTSPSFRWANSGMFAYSLGFNAMFLGNVLFLTEVWHYSIMRAGVAIAGGPVIVALTATSFGKLASRVGQRALLIPGGLVWATGPILLITRATTTPEYVSVYLPTIVLTGIGVSMCFPQLSSASVRDLPADLFGSGAAVNQSMRNLAATLGVAATVAITAAASATASADGAMDAFRTVWWLILASGITVTLLSTLLPRRASLPGGAAEVAVAPASGVAAEVPA
jgi:EmrB/QacA subfamily drug resistance transporter